MIILENANESIARDSLAAGERRQRKRWVDEPTVRCHPPFCVRTLVLTLRKVNCKIKPIKSAFSVFLVCFLLNCGLIKDADCVKQKNDQERCVQAFLVFCNGNQSRSECDGSVNSIITIGAFCNVGVACKVNDDDVVKEQIQPGKGK